MAGSPLRTKSKKRGRPIQELIGEGLVPVNIHKAQGAGMRAKRVKSAPRNSSLENAFNTRPASSYAAPMPMPISRNEELQRSGSRLQDTSAIMFEEERMRRSAEMHYEAGLNAELDRCRSKMRMLQNRVYELEAMSDPVISGHAEMVKQRTDAVEQANAFREDVRFLTAEMDSLMRDYKREAELRHKAEAELRRLVEENKHFRHLIELDPETSKLVKTSLLAVEAAEKIKGLTPDQALIGELETLKQVNGQLLSDNHRLNDERSQLCYLLEDQKA